MIFSATGEWTGRHDRLLMIFMLAVTLFCALGMTVNPWMRDNWFQTQDLLFAHLPGADNIIPIAAPAVLFKINHLIAAALGLDLEGELYVGMLVQNLLVFLSAWLTYRACRWVAGPRTSAFVAVALLIHLLATGVAQAFWSETTVLALLAGVLVINMRFYGEPESSARSFWPRAVLSAVLIGVAVITRVVPIFLIPAVLVLLYGRVSRLRLIGYGATLCAIVGLIVALMMMSNYARFGRVEITNSSGRHLWQGVAQIVDDALGSEPNPSPEYAELKAINPKLQGLEFWEVRLPHGAGEEQRDTILGRVAKQAVLAAPGQFLWQGVAGFADTIGRPIYRVGFGVRLGFKGTKNHYDPLNTDEFLEPLAAKVPFVPDFAVKVMSRGIGEIYEWGRLLYPVAIFLALTSCLRLLSQQLRFGFARRRGGSDSTADLLVRGGTLVHLAIGALLLAFVQFGGESERGMVWYYIPRALCFAVLVLQLWIIRRSGSVGAPESTAHRLKGMVYASWALLFFGSMWFSWQVEADNSRNALPYLPFLAVVVAMAVEDWTESRAFARHRSEHESRAPWTFSAARLGTHK